MKFHDLTSGSGPYRFLFYFIDQSYDQLDKIKFKYLLTLYLKSIIIYSYFVTNDENFVTLSTIEMFKGDCGVTRIGIVNKFDKKSSKWEKELKFEDKFMDFNGCELVMLLPVPFNERNYNFGYAVINRDSTDFEIFGLTPEIFRTAADKYNFIAAYQPVDGANFMIRPYPENLYCFEINGIVKTPTVIFDVVDLNIIIHEKMQIGQTFISVKSELYSTPAEHFSSYEKFLMIFDGITWILLDVVIVFTILAALIAHRLSLTVFNLTSFRFILFFICLVFVIFFQNKSFEFMAAEPRRLPPKTIQDLIDGNYSILESGPMIYENM